MNLITTASSIALDFMLPRQQLQQWTIRGEDGSQIFDFTSFLSLDLRNEAKVVEGPVEEGGFATYNKVQLPIEASVSIGIQGENAELQAALDRLDELQAGTELLSLVTPDFEYSDLSLEMYSYQRKRDAGGIGVLYVDLELKEIKQVEAQYTNVKLGKKKQRGKVQAKETSALSGLSSWVKG